MKTALPASVNCLLFLFLSNISNAQYIPEQMFTIDSLIMHQDMLNNQIRAVTWNNKAADYNDNGQIILMTDSRKFMNNHYFDTLHFYYSGATLDQKHIQSLTFYKKDLTAKYTSQTYISALNGKRMETNTSISTSFYAANRKTQDTLRTEKQTYSKFNYTITNIQTFGNRDTLHFHRISKDSVITDVLNHTTLQFHFESMPANDSLRLQYTQFSQFGPSGRIISEKRGAFNISYTYDSLSRLIKIVQTEFSFDSAKRIYVQPNVVRSVEYAYYGEGLVQEHHFTYDYDRKVFVPYYTVDWEFHYNRNGLIHSVQTRYRRNPTMSDDFYRTEDVPDAIFDNDHSRKKVRIRYAYY